MKKILLSTVALVGFTAGAVAADLPARTAPEAEPSLSFAPTPAFTWTGAYVGVQAGYAWGENSGTGIVDDDPLRAFAFDADMDGFVGGAHAGYNVQFGSFVVGVEGDIEYVGFGDDNIVIVGPDAGFVTTEMNFQASLRARLGYAFDRFLIYGTGGLAYANLDTDFEFSDLGNSFDEDVFGWTVGAGVEYAFTDNLTTRLEYRYTKYESSDFSGLFDDDGDPLTVPVGFTASSSDPEFHTVRVGVSYKF